jgi:hypothetical protein
MILAMAALLAVPFLQGEAQGAEPKEKKVWLDFYKFCLESEQKAERFSVVACRERAAKENGYEGWYDFVSRAKKALPAEAWARIQKEANAWYKEQPGAGRGRGGGMAGMKAPVEVQPDFGKEEKVPEGLVDWEEKTAVDLFVQPRDLTEEEKKALEGVDVPSRVAEVMKARFRAFGLEGAQIRVGAKGKLAVSLPPLGAEDIEHAKVMVLQRGNFRFRLVAEDAVADKHRGKEAPAGMAWLGLAVKGGKDEKLLVQLDDGWNLGGEIIEKAVIDKDQLGFPAVGFSIKKAFQDKFHDYTSKNSAGALPPGSEGRRLALILDDMVLSAPVIQSGIRDRGIISAGGSKGFSVAEQKILVAILNSGEYPVEIILVEERKG